MSAVNVKFTLLQGVKLGIAIYLGMAICQAVNMVVLTIVAALVGSALTP